MIRIDRWPQILIAVLLIGFSGTLFSGCTQAPSSPPASPAVNVTGSPTTQKTGTTSRQGKIEVSGKIVLLKSNQDTITLDSYSVDLKQYNGQTVTVTGKYSGDTLYVSSVQPQTK